MHQESALAEGSISKQVAGKVYLSRSKGLVSGLALHPPELHFEPSAFKKISVSTTRVRCPPHPSPDVVLYAYAWSH
jgi:hypothetical protein